MPLSISFCTTCKNRTQHLKLTLPQNLINNPRSQFIVLDYNSQDDLLEYLKSHHEADILRGQLVVYSNRTEPKFKMAHAKNMAHRLGMRHGADVLVNLDADNLTGVGFEEFIAWKFKRPDIFLYANVMNGIAKDSMGQSKQVTRGLNGRIVVTVSSFIKVGGYNEKFDTWGPDDKDFYVRMKKVGYTAVEIDPSFLLGVPHNDKTRFREYPHLSRLDFNDGQYNAFKIEKWMVTDVSPNHGSFGCGAVYKNFDFDKPISLAPLPNKVFGIGMHKTATTSLHHAFEILGLESWHWSSAHVAKAIWREMNNDGTSPTIDKYDALGDLPIPLLYWQLDKAYPGSKFILTLRDEKSWLDAVDRHFDGRYNTHFDGWSQDPFTNRIHQILYGRQTFDASVMLERYQRHNREVLEYFKDRPNDLLVMEVGEGLLDWGPLCAFLDKPTPRIKYPKSYVGAR